MLFCRAKDGKPEIDFETDVSDFRLPEIQIEELRKGLRSSGSQRAEHNIPDMHYSLRVSRAESAHLCDHYKQRRIWGYWIVHLLLQKTSSTVVLLTKQHPLSLFSIYGDSLVFCVNYRTRPSKVLVSRQGPTCWLSYPWKRDRKLVRTCGSTRTFLNVQ